MVGCSSARASHHLELVGKTEIVGRIAYLKDEVPHMGRQCSDAIFAIGYQSDPDFRFEFGFLFNR